MDAAAHPGAGPDTIAELAQPETQTVRANTGEQGADRRGQHAAGTTITLAYAKSSSDAETIPAQAPAVLGISVLLGLFFIVESFGPFLIGTGLVSSPQALALIGLTTRGGLHSVMLLQLVVGANLVLFASGTDKGFFRPERPAAPLFLLLLLAQVATTLMCATGMLVEPIPWQAIGCVWAYSLVWLVILRSIWLIGERVAAFLAARQLDRRDGVPSTGTTTTTGGPGGRLRPYLIVREGAPDDRPS